MLRKIAIRTGIAVFSILLALFGVEIVLRLFFPQPNFHLVEYREDGYYANVANFDDLFAIISKSFSLQDFQMKQYLLNVRTNSSGMRGDREVPYEKKEWIERILLLGDSLGFWFPLEEKDTFAKIVETSASNREVLNASYVGSHPATDWKAYDSEWRKYSSDVVILQALIWSPVEDHVFLDQQGPDFQEIQLLQNKGLGKHVVTKKDVAGMDGLMTNGSGSGKIRDAIRTEARLARPFLSRFQIYRIVQMAKFLVLWKNPNAPAPSPPSFAIHRSKPVARDYSNTLAYVRAFRKDADSRSAKFLFLLIPNRMGCITTTHDDWKKLLEQLKADHTDYLDFYDDFCIPYKNHAGSVFLDGEIHINAEGNAAIAKKIIEFLQK